MAGFKKYRKRHILIEKLIPRISQTLDNGYFTWDPVELYRNNRFVVNLEGDNNELSIQSHRIRSLYFEKDNNGNSILKIKTLLSIVDNWIDEFELITLAKIYFLDPTGVVIKTLDYDVVFSGYNFMCNYNSDDLFEPEIIYTIID